MTSITPAKTGRRASLGLALAATLALAAFAPAAQASKKVDHIIGSPTGAQGEAGGLFHSPRGVVVNSSGAGGVAAGELYVVDSGNRRIEEFSPSGAFVRAWGKDVIKPGAPNDSGTGFEVCDTTALTPDAPSDCQKGTAGSLGGEMDSPHSIAVDQSSGAVYVGEGDNQSSGASPQPRIQKFSAKGEFIAAFGWDVLSGGGTTFEVCTVAAECQAGVAGANAGQISRESGLAVGPSGDLYVAEESNRRIQRFDASGAFVSAWGWDVIPAGKPGDTGANVYERCPASAAATAGDCRGGDTSSDNDTDAPGHFGFSGAAGPNSIAVAPSGKVYAIDRITAGSARRRILSFEADGSSPAVFVGGASTPQSLYFPTSIGAGPSGHVFVVTYCSPANNSCSDISPGINVEPRILEFDASGALVDTHLRNWGIGELGFTNVAVNPNSGDLYVSVGNGNRVFVADDDGAAPPPAVSLLAPSPVGAHTATFHGTVNPNGPAGIPTSYHFEYSRDGVEWKSVSGTPLAPPDGIGVQSVSATVTGLEANVSYQVRIVAKKAFGASEEVLTAPLAFFTEGPAPDVKTLQAQSFSDTEAIISATVNPNNRATTYRFEYGESVAYGKQAPLADGELEGGVDKYVSEQIEGLQPETTYHFRIVATNEEGTSEGEDATFTTRPTFEGFPARAYEQISPRVKEADVQAFTPGKSSGDPELIGPLPASADGNHKAFAMWGALDSATWGGDRMSMVLAHRTDTGWVLDDISPHALPAGTGDNSGLNGGKVIGMGGPDLSLQLIGAENSLIDGEPGAHLQDSTANTMTPIGLFSGFYSTPFAASPELGDVAFSQGAVLTSDSGIPPAPIQKVYDWSGGELRLASFDPGGTPFATDSVLGSAGTTASSSFLGALNAVSSDGKHVFFTNPGTVPSKELTSAANIYRRDNGSQTIPVSPSKRTPTDPLGPQAKTYLDATADQSEDGPAAVFFASEEKLTNAATNDNPSGEALGDLYRYEVNSDTLTDISAETSDANGAEVLGMIGHSDDGDEVYYVANGVLAPGATPGNCRNDENDIEQDESRTCNVYLWHDDGSAAGKTRFVARIGGKCLLGRLNATIGFPSSGDGCNYTTFQANNTASARTARVTADGRKLLFQSTKSLTGYPNQGHSELYLYEADANGGAGRLSCISCNPEGSPAAGDTLGAPAGGALESVGGLGQDPVRSLSPDGKRILFDSPEALLPEDTNGKLDVYEWLDGHLALISTGKSSDDSRFENASADGSTVFLTTREPLVGVDDDPMADLYAARVGGGFAWQNPPPPGVPCAGDVCKPGAASTPSASSPASSGLTGRGNLGAPGKPSRCAKGKVKVRRHGKSRCVKRHPHKKHQRAAKHNGRAQR